MKRRIVLKIHGDVQGVGFRYGVRNFSQERNIFGWAKNESDGAVYVVAEGEEHDLHGLLDYCYHGISSANVQSIDVDWEKIQNNFSGFAII